MKKGNKFLSLLLSGVMTLGSFSFTGLNASANNTESSTVLFEETFEANYGNTTSYNGKTGAWKIPAGKFSQSGSGEASEIHVLKGVESNVDFAFSEPYTEKMVLKVTADFITGVADANNTMRIDVVGLNETYTANDDGRLTLCYLTNGKIYANCMGATAARETGATYTEGQKLTAEGIIDEANKKFTLSVFDRETGDAILENYNVTPYKHDKSNYYELTHGFTGIRFLSKRASDANQAFELYDIKVEQVIEKAEPWVVTEDDIALSDEEGAIQTWNAVSVNLSSIGIDFGEAMDESTLTTSTVYIENAQTKEKVAYTPDYDSNVYTLTINEALEEETTYNIVIQKAVTSAAGGANLSDTVFSFTTAAIENPEADNNVLLEETFEANYGKTTSYNEKTGAWKIPEEKFFQSGSGETSEIHVLKGQEGNVDFAFNEPYTEKMRLKVTADFIAGVADANNTMRIDVVGLNETYTANDDGRLTLCYLTNGKIYANCMAAADARDTGAKYTAGQRLIAEGIINQETKKFTLSVYDKATGDVLLKNYNVTPYKHDKSNYYELTHGFTGIRFLSKRASDANQAFELYDIKVEQVIEKAEPWVVTEDDITLSDEEGAIQAWNAVSVNLSSIGIDFGEAMNETTLTTSTVYLENAQTKEKVAYTPDYESNVYTLTLSEALAEKTAYNIVIKKTVASAVGGLNVSDTVFSFTTASEKTPEEDEDDTAGDVLFDETFDTDFANKTEYNGRTGKWIWADTSALIWSEENGDGRVFAQAGKSGEVEYVIDNGEEYTDKMVLQITADVMAGSDTSTDFGRIDILGSEEADGKHKISLCSFYGGKIYANCMSEDAKRDTGARYEAGKRYIVKGVVDEENEVFKLSVYEKETGEAILKNYIVSPYKHSKSNWLTMSHGFKGVLFFADRRSSGEYPFSLYSLKVEKLLHPELEISQASIQLTDSNGTVQALDNANILTNKIEVNFGMPMNSNSLSANTVYILNTQTNEKVAYTSAYSDNIYTMNLTKALETETEYQIVFTSSIKTVYGDEYGQTTVIPFVTVSEEDVLEADGAYDSTFEFDDLTGWTKAGLSDTFVSNGTLSVPNTSTGERQVVYTFDQAYSEKMVLEASYEISTGINTLSRVQLNGANGYIVLATFNGGYIYANTYSTENTTGVAYEPGKTYTVKCRVDQFEGILSVTVLDEEGNIVVKDFEDAPFGGNNGRGDNIVGLSKISVVNNILAIGETAPVLDNLKVREILSAPVISADDVSIGIMGGETAQSFKNVNPASNIVTLGVGTSLNTNTLNADNIKLLKGNEEVDITIAYAKRTITIIINEILSANEEYTIFVSENIENTDNVKMSDDVEIKFTTGSSSTKASINGISVNDKTVDSMSQISNGDNLFINIDYMNSTGEDKTLHVIVAGYNGNSLVSADYITQDVDKSIIKSTIVVESGNFNTEGVEYMMVMLWDGFDTMHPLSTYVPIN